MTIHTPITIRTAPETCIARTQRPSAERLLAAIFYIDVALDVGPTSSVLAYAAPGQSDPRCHRGNTRSRPRSVGPTHARCRGFEPGRSRHLLLADSAYRFRWTPAPPLATDLLEWAAHTRAPPK